jgi:hypothetical protein
MRFIFLTITTAILVVLLNAVAPFWAVMMGVSVISALIAPSGIGGFMGGGLGMGLTWLGQCIYLDIVSNSSLPDKMGDLMGLGSGMTLVALTGVIGFLLGAFSGWTGILFRKMLVKNPEIFIFSVVWNEYLCYSLLQGLFYAGIFNHIEDPITAFDKIFCQFPKSQSLKRPCRGVW